jgi:hypothetical protein
MVYPLSYARIALTTFGATVGYFIFGAVMLGLLKPMGEEFRKYPAVYRTPEDMMGVMPVAIIATLFSIAVLTVIYAMLYRGGSGVAEGARFGALIGLFVVGSNVLHNYVNLNIGSKLTIWQVIVYFIQWMVVGILIGLIYRPAAP